jgi:hypothetical protein
MPSLSKKKAKFHDILFADTIDAVLTIEIWNLIASGARKQLVSSFLDRYHEILLEAKCLHTLRCCSLRSKILRTPLNGNWAECFGWFCFSALVLKLDESAFISLTRLIYARFQISKSIRVVYFMCLHRLVVARQRRPRILSSDKFIVVIIIVIIINFLRLVSYIR